MQGKEEVKKMVPSPSHTQLFTNASAAARELSSSDDSESFYTKLTELLESSGLSLIFNARETLLDLYLFYLEVTRRGGYHQVGQEKKWGEVVSALKLEGSNAKLSAQVEKLYAHLLYQFEKLYFYRCSAQQAATRGSLKRKLNSTASLSQLMDNEDDESEDFSSQMTGGSCEFRGAYAIPLDLDSYLKQGGGYVEEQPRLLPVPTDDKEMEKKKRRGAPPGQRTAYQIFLKQECARLRACCHASNGTRILRMAIDAWKKMSEIEKQPYVEESKKNKEKIKEAMIPYNKQKITQDSVSGDYCVTSQPEADQDDSLVNKAAVDLALKMTEKASKDPLFLADWDACCSLELPTGESM